MSHPEISEAERFPLLTDAGRRFLHAMREHPRAPRWNWPNGEQLDAEGLARVRDFAEGLAAPRPSDAPAVPDWLTELVDFCLQDVPYYRRRTPAGTRFQDLPSCNREDLTRNVCQFVPDSQPLDRLIVFSSSGTTGHPARLPSHPWTAACGVPLLEKILQPAGLVFPRGTDRLALTHIVAYPGAYTTALVMSYLDEAGCVRVNLDPGVWRKAADCSAFLDETFQAGGQDPGEPRTVYLGDPLAFDALTRIDIRRPPAAILSSIATLSDAFAQELRDRYGCPVMDVYALTEAGIVAVQREHGHAVVPHDVYVEVLDEQDEPCPPGVRGEVAISGGRNPFAPLLRYRTGDYASLARIGGVTYLQDLEGRDPVVFSVPGDRVVHSMEVSRLLRPFSLVQFTLAQLGPRTFELGYRGSAELQDVRDALESLLGPEVEITVRPLPAQLPRQRKVVQYSGLTVPKANS